jgi:hypothetical protein
MTKQKHVKCFANEKNKMSIQTLYFVEAPLAAITAETSWV